MSHDSLSTSVAELRSNFASDFRTCVTFGSNKMLFFPSQLCNK